MKTHVNETFVAHYNDICRYIAHSAFEKIKKEFQDDDWDDEDIWLSAVFNMIVDINDGESEDVIAHKILNDFLRGGMDVDLHELIKIERIISAVCEQELVAAQITRIAFESGTVPEITYTKVKEILS